MNFDSEGTRVTWKRGVMFLKGKRRKVLWLQWAKQFESLYLYPPSLFLLLPLSLFLSVSEIQFSVFIMAPGSLVAEKPV